MAEGFSRSPRIVILWTTEEQSSSEADGKKVISAPVVETTGKTHNRRTLF